MLQGKQISLFSQFHPKQHPGEFSLYSVQCHYIFPAVWWPELHAVHQQRFDHCLIKLKHNLPALAFSILTDEDDYPIFLLNHVIYLCCHLQEHHGLSVPQYSLGRFHSWYCICPSLICIHKMYHLTIIRMKLHLLFHSPFHDHTMA